MPTDGMTKAGDLLERIEERRAATLRREQRSSERLAALTSEGWLPSDDDCAACLQRPEHKAPVGRPGRVLVQLPPPDGPTYAPCAHLRPDCPLLGAQREEAKERQEAARQQALAAEREWLREIGIGRRYLGAERGRLREPVEIGAYLDALAGAVEAGQGLVLLGPLGVGKTAALSVVARHAYAVGVRSAWYTTMTRLMRHILRGTEMIERRDRVGCVTQEDPAKRRLLLLDEFGAAYESDYAMATFEDYMGWRYDEQLATCVAANLTPDQIRSSPHYARMLDRWRETCAVIVIGGESQRRPLAGEG